MRVRHLAAAAALLLALTGCSMLKPRDTTAPNTAPPATSAAAQPQPTPSASTTETTGVPDPCNLITDKEVGVASGSTVVRHSASEDGQIKKCLFELPQVNIEIFLTHTTKEEFDAARKADSSGAKSVSGLGDAAFLAVNANTLHVLHKTYRLSVNYYPYAEHLAIQKKIAAKILPQLP